VVQRRADLPAKERRFLAVALRAVAKRFEQIADKIDSGVIIFFVTLILMRAHKLLHMLVVLAGLVFIVAIIIVISGGIFFRIWSALR
jgi:hypothetical protein